MREVLTRLPSTRACCYLYPLCEHPLAIGDFHASMETKAPVAARQHMMRVKLCKIYVYMPCLRVLPLSVEMLTMCIAVQFQCMLAECPRL